MSQGQGDGVGDDAKDVMIVCEGACSIGQPKVVRHWHAARENVVGGQGQVIAQRLIYACRDCGYRRVYGNISSSAARLETLGLAS